MPLLPLPPGSVQPCGLQLRALAQVVVGRAGARARAGGERVVLGLELHDHAAVVAHPEAVDSGGILVHPMLCGEFLDDLLDR